GTSNSSWAATIQTQSARWAFCRTGRPPGPPVGNKAVRFWDLASRKQTAEILHDELIYCAVQSRDGRWLATLTTYPGNRGEDHPVRVWNLLTRKLVAIVATNHW